MNNAYNLKSITYDIFFSVTVTPMGGYINRKKVLINTFYADRVLISTNTFKKLQIFLQCSITLFADRNDKFSFKIFSWKRSYSNILPCNFRISNLYLSKINFYAIPNCRRREMLRGGKDRFSRKTTSLSHSLPPLPSHLDPNETSAEKERGGEGEEDMRKRSNHPRSVSNNRVAVLFILAFFLSVAGTVSVIRGPIFTHAFCFRARWMSDNEAWGL